MQVTQTFICADESFSKNLTGILLFDRLPDNIDGEELYRLLRMALTDIADNAPHCSGQVICEDTTMYSSTSTPGLAEISQTLRELGMPANLLGYQYLRFAIYSAVRKPEILRAITKQLYPYVAGEFHTTAGSVERAMRYAVEVVWNRGNIETLEKYFGYTVDPNRGKPTNSEFVSQIVDKLTLGMQSDTDRTGMGHMGNTA
ncbi:MAG: sporulation initiation factor Spo0A C-terminal domain-containing protein [Bacillota bacterium]|nr:sporulation initiation factor Spo0A C-terminal domain-containing protein [Bacillota bacterium]